MSTLPAEGEIGIAQDTETGAQVITSEHPMYQHYLSMLRGGGQGGAARHFSGKLLAQRKVLTMDELLNGKNHRMRFEQHFPEVRAFFYTVDLMLAGEQLTGALLAGSCALIFAHTRHAADELAAAGLQTTLEAGFAYAFGHAGETQISPELEFGGRKGDPSPVSPDTLKTDIRTREAIINRIEGKAKEKRWKH